MKYLDQTSTKRLVQNTKDLLDDKANKNHTHSASDITSGLATVATSGSYNDLSNKPTIPTVDSALSNTSTNPVQNKVIDGALGNKSDVGHTHTVSDVTDFPTLATVATSGSYNDLSNKPTSMTPASHTHGSISNDGKLGTTANMPLITTTGGSITTGSFGNSAGTFCEGNDSRLSDARTPTQHNHSASEITSGTLDSARIPNLDASKITSGTIDIARLPVGALERLVVVADQTARYALTTSSVQLGDTVKQTDTGVMYYVVDTAKLNSEDGYSEFTAGMATSVPWSGVTGKPSDFTPSSHTHGNISNDGKLGTASRVVVTDSNKAVDVSSVTSTELGYLSGVTSSLQTQINSKANDSSVVHTTGNESISGTKSFNDDLNLNYAVTDVDDIVDSTPGTGTSDDFVHLTGAETVNGVKSFPDGIVANVSGNCTKDGDGNVISSTYGKLAGNQTWSGENSFTYVYLNHKHIDLEMGVTPASNQTRRFAFADKNNNKLGWIQHRVNTSGESYIELLSDNKFANSQLDPQGSDIVNSLAIGVSGNGTRYATILSDFYPQNANITCKLGTSSNRWSSVYADSYYYGTTAWGLDKENVWTAHQKITGNNSRGVLSIYNPAYTKGSATSTSDLSIGTIFLGNGGATGLANSLGFVSCDLSASGNKTTLSLSAIKNEASSTERANLILLYDKSDNTNPEKMLCKGAVIPNSDSMYPLGTSTNKWKTLNGVNPGALSFPNPDAVINLDTTGWDVAGALNNTYTPVVNGWLAIDIKDTATNSVFIYSKGLNSSKAYSASVYGNGSQGTGRLSLMMPAIANAQYAFVIKADSLSDISYARFYPCLGNV